MKFFTLLVAVLIPALSAYADLESGIAAYQRSDFKTAFREFSASAEAKNPEGLHLLAALYYEGKGVEKDLSKAVSLFKEAAKLGYRASQANLGLMYQRGEGVPVDISLAIDYYEAAAAQGDVQSMFNLGQLWRKGEQVRPDLKKAFGYYEKAAKLGYTLAIDELGLMYAEGNGVKQDYLEAFAWISIAAEQGNEGAKEDVEQLKKLLGDRLPAAIKRSKAIRESIGEPKN